ncbi:MAG: anti sigma factor C-terminal domain-containing protein [Clostridia bacterium]|nr:anti sigma factor C-terminal domain-containing protein [Clostridia bacterium]
MKYRELLDLYKKGELPEDEKTRVAEDIERQEAISEFLFENDDIPELIEASLEAEIPNDNSDFDEKKFQKMIKKSIHKAFLKLGVAVGVIVLALVLVANTALPHIVDFMYYDPAKIVGRTENGVETNRISLDTSVYSELFTPGFYRTNVFTHRDGYGDYDIQILQNFSESGQFTDVFGKIEKGKMTIYTDNAFQLPTQNAFVPEEIPNLSGHAGTGAAGTVENSFRKLNELDESDYYLTYVTLDKVMTYDQLVAWSNKTGIVPTWCALCKELTEGPYDYSVNDIVGFNFLSSCGEMGYDNEKYPYLNYFDMLSTIEDFPEDNFSNEVMTQHVLSLLRYSLDNPEFREMAGCIVNDMELRNLMENIEEHGLNIYGFAVVAQKEQILKISQTENVKYIYTTPQA